MQFVHRASLSFSTHYRSQRRRPPLALFSSCSIGLIALNAAADFRQPTAGGTPYSASQLLFMLVGLLGGLGIFLLGMEFSEKGLKRIAGDKMKTILSALTTNRIIALLLGASITALLQSSSASTVMIVGFVEASAMNLSQAIGVTIGAKIGTTITTQLIAFNLSQYSLILVALGFLLRMLGKKKTIRQIGNITLGFGLIFFGLGVMSDAMRPLRSIPIFSNMVVQLEAMPLLGILIALIFTAVVQSSAATIGLAIALCASQVLTVQEALPIAWGAHIGTCATALLASLGTGPAGKQVALAHLLLSIFGVLIAIPFLTQLIDAARWVSAFIGSSSPARDLANGHMLFTIITGLIMLLFVNQLKWLTEKIIPCPQTPKPFGPKFLNRASLDIPDLALELAHREILRLADIVRSMLDESILLLEHPSQAAVIKMDKEDDKVDILEKAIRPYLAEIAQSELSDPLIAREHAFIYIVQEFEGIGDLITREIARSSKKLDRRNVAFSDQGIGELKLYHVRLMNKFDQLYDAVKQLDRTMAQNVLDQIEEDHTMERFLKQAHLERLHNGQKETIETSAYHFSTLNNMRAVSERLDDMARTIVEELKS